MFFAQGIAVCGVVSWLLQLIRRLKMSECTNNKYQ